MNTFKKFQTLPEKIISIDFSTSMDRTGLIQGDGESLNIAIDKLTIYDVAIVVYVPETPYNTSYCYDYKINFKPGQEKQNIEFIKKVLTEGACLVAYNGRRMDYLILERKLGIDTSKYKLVDTCLVQRVFNSKTIRRGLCINKQNYSRIQLENYSHMHLSDVYHYFTGKEMYQPIFTKRHFSTIDALTNMDVFLLQFSNYGFTCVDEMIEMSEYFSDSARKQDNYKYFFTEEAKNELFKRIDYDSYTNENKIIFKIGQYKGKSIDELSDNELEYILKKYKIPYIKDGEVINEHDPFPYEILYMVRLEYKKRLENKEMV